MESIHTLLRRYPNRIKYGLLILDFFAMFIAIKTYMNYVSIETAIEDATIAQEDKTNELYFTENFLVHYEKSDYAKYFLEHENNMLLGDEYIVKFEEMYQKQEAITGATTNILNYGDEDETIKAPQQSWKKFIIDKFNGK